MPDWKVAESLVDWLNVTEYDGVLTTENTNVAEDEDVLTKENTSVTEYEDSVTGHKDVPATENTTTALFLTGESFLSHCWLPNVKPNTKIFGICGITDWNEENDPKLPGAAAPNREGWHFADFYLFHHMLKEVASDQVWLTCVSPESAVEKYGRYIYGDYSPKKIETRRVVLEESKLCELNDVQTVSPESLLDTALATISCLRRALGGDRKSDIRYSRTRADYRINGIMGTATLYEDFLGIDHPGCHEVEVERTRGGERWIEIKSLIHTYPLFNSCCYNPFYKINMYLAKCISLQEWSKSEKETIAKLDSLVQYRESPTCPLYDWGANLNPDYSYSGVPTIKGASRSLETINQFRLSRHEDI